MRAVICTNKYIFQYIYMDEISLEGTETVIF